MKEQEVSSSIVWIHACFTTSAKGEALIFSSESQSALPKLSHFSACTACTVALRGPTP